MPVMTPVSQIGFSPGSTIAIHGISWQEFEAILMELGDHRHTRIAFSQEGNYKETVISPTFSDRPITEIVPQVVRQAWEIGTSQALLEFEAWFRGRSPH